MQYYCKKCLLLNIFDRCEFCGKKKLRVPTNNDYCFLFEADSMSGEMFCGVLDVENIPYSAMPFGTGVRSAFAMKLENVKIFVPYEFYQRAKELLSTIHKNIEETLISELKINIDKLFVMKSSEKKIKKILNLAKTDNLISYCKDKVINADRIEVRGKISSCSKGGNYLYVYNGKEQYFINSATYEIISVKMKRDPKKELKK